MSETLTEEQKQAKADALLKQEIENKRLLEEEEAQKSAELKAKELKEKLNKERAEKKDLVTRAEELEAKVAKMEQDKENAEKKALLTELVLIDPKLGEANKTSDKRDLEIAIRTAKLLKGSTFGDHSQADRKPDDRASGGIGIYDRKSGDWI